MSERMNPLTRTARSIAREQLTATIVASARAQLGTVGAAALSVRAVARDVGMVSSAVYRYFPSRDELLTALLIACYDELGAAAETAEAAVQPRSDLLGRWLAVAYAVRDWAVAHPHDWALLYGSPVLGYAAPESTIASGTRVSRLLVALLAEVPADDVPEPPTNSPEIDLHSVLSQIREFADLAIPDELQLRGLMAWSGLIGAVSVELFGQFGSSIGDLDSYFAAVAHRLVPFAA